MRMMSNRNTYSTSTGERLTRTQIEWKIRKAKEQVLRKQREVYGYNFCSVCMRNDCVPIDCSHDISVKTCLEQGKAELAWDVNNIKPTGRRCHNIKDKLI